MFIKIIAGLLLACGTIFIFDARRVARRFFTTKSRNDTTGILQNVGVILVIISFVIMASFII